MNFEVWVLVANVVMWLEYRDNRRGGGGCSEIIYQLADMY